MSPTGSQTNRCFFYEEEKQDSIQKQVSDPEGALIINQDPEGEISTMVVVKWSDKLRGPIVKVDGPLCGGIYKKDHGSIVTWSVTVPDSKLNCFT